jgi:hypothetical protein
MRHAGESLETWPAAPARTHHSPCPSTRLAMPLNDPAHAFVPYPDVPVPHAGTGP